MSRTNNNSTAVIAQRPSTLLAAIDHHAVVRGDAPAILAPGERPAAALSYRRLARRIHAARRCLAGLGVRPGHRVAVVTGEDRDSGVLLLSVLSSAGCCPMNPIWPAAEAQEHLAALGAALVIVTGSAAAAATAQLAAVKAPVVTLRFTGDDEVVADRWHENRAIGEVAETAYEDEALLLRTSGTTAAGKIVSLDAASVVAAAEASVRAYHLTETDRRLNIMPFFHVQGLVGSLATALLAGGSIVCVPAPDPVTVLRHAADTGATWLSATPAMHRMMLGHIAEHRERLGALRFVRCGSGALTSTLRAELEAGYGIPVVESYGMSEAHQIASTPLPPDPSATGLVPTGSRVAVLDPRGAVRTDPGASGEIVIQGANRMRGYVWPPGAESPFVDGWLRTGDLGRLLEDGSFLITGRAKEMINASGEKVSPFEVESAMLGHPAVREAAVFGIPDPVRDERLAAVVVLHDGSALADDEFRAFLGKRLAPFKVPRQILRRAAIPVEESGKISRRSLAAVLAGELSAAAAAEAQPPSREAPRTPAEAMVRALWALVLRRDQIGVQDDFLALGGDSLTAVALLSMVEDSLGVAFSPLDLFTEVTTVAAMAEAIESRSVTPGAGER